MKTLVEKIEAEEPQSDKWIENNSEAAIMFSDGFKEMQHAAKRIIENHVCEYKAIHSAFRRYKRSCDNKEFEWLTKNITTYCGNCQGRIVEK